MRKKVLITVFFCDCANIEIMAESYVTYVRNNDIVITHIVMKKFLL